MQTVAGQKSSSDPTPLLKISSLLSSRVHLRPRRARDSCADISASRRGAYLRKSSSALGFYLPVGGAQSAPLRCLQKLRSVWDTCADFCAPPCVSHEDRHLGSFNFTPPRETSVAGCPGPLPTRTIALSVVPLLLTSFPYLFTYSGLYVSLHWF